MGVITPKATLLRVPAFDRMVEASRGQWNWRKTVTQSVPVQQKVKKTLAETVSASPHLS